MIPGITNCLQVTGRHETGDARDGEIEHWNRLDRAIRAPSEHAQLVSYRTATARSGTGVRAAGPDDDASDAPSRPEENQLVGRVINRAPLRSKG
jgi:hypothetical protein